MRDSHERGDAVLDSKVPYGVLHGVFGVLQSHAYIFDGQGCNIAKHDKYTRKYPGNGLNHLKYENFVSNQC